MPAVGGNMRMHARHVFSPACMRDPVRVTRNSHGEPRLEDRRHGVDVDVDVDESCCAGPVACLCLVRRCGGSCTPRRAR